MKVMDYILATLKSHKMHMSLIDPASQDADRAGEIAAIADRLGTDAFMVGGSTGVNRDNLERTVKAIRKAAPKKPVIHFPTGARVLSPSVDAIYFMSFLNSKNTRNIVGEQVAGAPIIKRYGIEPIPMGYVVVEPGMKVGEVGEAQLVRRDDFETAKSFAIAAEYFGMKLLYLEAGSGASEPVPAGMVRAVRGEIRIPLIVGGGIRSAAKAKDLTDAGADILVTGTIVEMEHFERRLGEILKAIR
jgi:phosphoglycerol geranylgeranyltransferase